MSDVEKNVSRLTFIIEKKFYRYIVSPVLLVSPVLFSSSLLNLFCFVLLMVTSIALLNPSKVGLPV
jgi:hypothetical protein